MDELPQPDEIALPIAAHRLGQKYLHVYGRMISGELPGRRVGNRWYVDAAAVDRLVELARRERERQTA
jgi:hypothetical protein